MNRTMKSLGCILLIAAMCSSAFAGNMEQAGADTSGREFHVTLAPANAQTGTASTEQNMTLQVTTETNEFKHDTQIPITVKAAWDQENWNATLAGVALVFNNGSQVVLFGMVSGYNGERVDENFISLNFTYDVASGNCIANATYDILSEQNSQMEFGVNTELFADANQFLSDKMAAAHQEQLSGSDEANEDGAIAAQAYELPVVQRHVMGIYVIGTALKMSLTQILHLA